MKKLTLKKEIVSQMSNDELWQAKGGTTGNWTMSVCNCQTELPCQTLGECSQESYTCEVGSASCDLFYCTYDPKGCHSVYDFEGNCYNYCPTCVDYCHPETDITCC